MSIDDPCIVGVEACGCVTYANSRPNDLDSHDEAALGRILREGGQVIRTTVAGAHAMPNFMPVACPHGPEEASK